MLILLGLMQTWLWAQTSRSSWKKNETLPKLDLQLFHSNQAVNLPTAETLQKGDWEFEISHRFFPPVTSGPRSFWGLDGPVNMRIGLGFAPTNRLVITLARSNVNDNIDMRVKHKTVQIRNRRFPLLIGWQAGTGWNTQVAGRKNRDPKNFQYYGQLIFNTLLLNKKLGLGVVPTYVYNSYIFCPNNQYSYTLGSYAQFYAGPFFSVLAEWNPTYSGFRNKYNVFSFGIELETGGHFFKIILTNSHLLNPSQFNSGADLRATDGDWRIGFNITRLLSFHKS
jgi:hypothetical protein